MSKEIDVKLKAIIDKIVGDKDGRNESFAWYDERQRHWEEVARMAQEIAQLFGSNKRLAQLVVSSSEKGHHLSAEEFAKMGVEASNKRKDLLISFEEKVYE